MALTTIDDRGLKTPIDLLDNEKIRFGTGNDLQIYHDGSHSYIKEAGTGNLYISASSKVQIDGANDETMARFNEDGGVELYYDNVKKFETTTEGAEIHGRFIVQDTGSDTIFNFGSGSNYIAQADDQVTIFRNRSGTERSQIDANGHYRNEDNIKLVCGTGQDLQIWHNGNDSVIRHTLTGSGNDLWIESDTNIFLGKTSGAESMAKFIADGPVELYCNNSKKIQTQDAGITVYGTIHIGDGASGTAAGLGIGDGDDLQIYHDGSNSRIKNDTGTLYVLGDRSGFLNNAESEWGVLYTANAAVELYYDGSKKFETTSSGVWTAGTLEVQNSASAGDALLQLKAGEGGTAYINFQADENDDNTDQMRILCPDGDGLKIQNKGSGSWESNLHCDPNAGVKLYYDNNLKLETTTGGGQLTGDWLIGLSTNDGSEAQLHSKNGQTAGKFWQTSTADWSTIVSRSDRATGTTQGWILVAEMNTGANVGGIKADGDETFFNTSSDYRLKENLVAVADGITRLKQLKPYKYNFKSTPSVTKEGFLAHEVAPVIPEAVSGTKDEVATEDDGMKKKGEPVYQTLDYSKLTPLLTAALQEALTKIETLETKVAALEAG